MDKFEIEKALCEHKRHKFTSAYSSPFLQEPLLSQVGQSATTPAAQLTHDNTKVLEMISNISNFAFNISLPLERWTRDLDVLLLKKTRYDHWSSTPLTL